MSNAARHPQKTLYGYFYMLIRRYCWEEYEKLWERKLYSILGKNREKT